VLNPNRHVCKYAAHIHNPLKDTQEYGAIGSSQIPLWILTFIEVTYHHLRPPSREIGRKIYRPRLKIAA